MLVVSVLLLGEAEAGCNQNGCCYCHKDQGYVLTSGLYQEDCDYGCEYLAKYLYLYRPCPHFHDPHLVLVGQDMRLKI